MDNQRHVENITTRSVGFTLEYAFHIGQIVAEPLQHSRRN